MRRLVLLPVLLVLAACGPPPLAHAHPSPDVLARAVLEALAGRDETRLRELALDEAEFRAHVWPSLPAGRPERNVPFGYVWGELRQKGAASLASTLAAHGGQRYDLVEVLLGERTEYAGFRVHRDTRVRVRQPAGDVTELRLCGSLIEKDGGWKVFSYVVDD